MFTVETAAAAAYIVAALLFILALAGLSKHETSKVGNTFGISGMAVALVATIAMTLDRHISLLGLALLIGAMSVGAAIGLALGAGEMVRQFALWTLAVVALALLAAAVRAAG